MLKKISRTSKSKKALFATAILLIIFGVFLSKINYKTQAQATIPTEPNLKIAFIGDTGSLNPGQDFEKVLQLIKTEGASAIMHQGDFDYNFNALGFFTKIADMDLDNDGLTRNLDGSLDLDYPYLTSVGNHDIESWPSTCTDPDGCYATYQKQILDNSGLIPDDPSLDDEMYSLEFKGLKLVFIGQTTANNSIYAQYINDKLTGSQNIWKICSWHKNRNAMQVGGKSDSMGWDVYENCRQQGAIITTAHEHSYERTKTLTNMTLQTVDPTCSEPGALCVDPGRTFAFVSGAGGSGLLRDQERCLPSTYPYGCSGEWASIYTNTQTDGLDRAGALFIIFNVDGNPNKAHGYFKNTLGEIIDEFDIFTNGETPPTPTPTLTPDPNATPTPTLTPTPSPTPTPVPQLLLNPSFEADTDNNNKPDVWTQSSVFVKSAELVQSGTFSGKFLNTSSKTIAQVVKNLTPGVYNYSAWVNIPQTSQTGFYATLRIVWRNSSGNNISTSVVKTYTGVTSGWDNATATLTAPAGTNRASVQILVKKLNGSVYVDNLSLTR